MLAALWPINFGSARTLASYSYIGFVTVNLIHLLAGLVVTINEIWDDASFDDICRIVEDTSSTIVALVYDFYFVYHHRELRDLFQLLEQGIVTRQRSAPGLTYTTMSRSIKSARNFTVVWVSFCVAGTVHHALAPLLDGKRELPLAAVYPAWRYESPYFELTYISQIFAQAHFGFVYGGIVALVASMSILLCGQFDLLFCSLKNTLATAMLVRGDSDSRAHLAELQMEVQSVPLEEVRNEYLSSYLELENMSDGITGSSRATMIHYRVGSHDLELMGAIRDCAEHHKFIVAVVQSTERFLHWMLLATLGQITLMISLITCSLSFRTQIDQAAIHDANYFSILFLMLFVLCYYPHMMTYQVDRWSLFWSCALVMILFAFRAPESLTPSCNRLGSTTDQRRGSSW